MPRLITRHLMHRIMDRIEIQLFRSLRQSGLAGSRAILGGDADFEVLLGGVGQDFAEEFRELRSMLCFFEGSSSPVLADLRIAFSVCDAAHGKIHADFRALAVEVLAESVDDILRRTLRDTDNMLRRPGHIFVLFREFGLRGTADGAAPVVREVVKLYAFRFFIIDITANTTNVLHSNIPLSSI